MLLNTKGAALKLGCSVTWIRKLATKKEIENKIKAYVYLDGVLTEHDPDNPHPGLELFFEEKDLEAYQPKVRRRAMGLKDKVGDSNPNRRGPKKAGTANDQ